MVLAAGVTDEPLGTPLMSRLTNFVTSSSASPSLATGTLASFRSRRHFCNEVISPRIALLDRKARIAKRTFPGRSRSNRCLQVADPYWTQLREIANLLSSNTRAHIRWQLATPLAFFGPELLLRQIGSMFDALEILLEERYWKAPEDNKILRRQARALSFVCSRAGR